MRRREVITLLGGAAAWPLVARAQQPAIPVIGYLDASGVPRWFPAFERGLAALGYLQSQSIAIEHRSAAGQAQRLPELAAELVRLQPKIIVASGSPAAVAARNATATIPIVFTFAPDPGGAWARCKPRPSGRQHHGAVESGRRTRRQKASAPRRRVARRVPLRRCLDPVFCGQSRRLPGDASSGAHTGSAAPILRGD